ncbi:MAG: hypothetical protein ACYTF1_20175 [Planctomycetota bacterium]
MQRLRIKGIVRQANRIRQQLQIPMTVDQRNRLDNHLKNTIRQVDAILRKHNTPIDQMPAPSRRAYHFLKQVDLKQVKLIDRPTNYPPATAAPPRDESVSFRGLKAYFDKLLNDIAQSLASEQFNADHTHRSICQTAKNLGRSMTVNGDQPRHLKPQSRKMLGWFRYFSDPHNFNDYLNAVKRAQNAFGRIETAKTRWPTNSTADTIPAQRRYLPLAGDPQGHTNHHAYPHDRIRPENLDPGRHAYAGE